MEGRCGPARRQWAEVERHGQGRELLERRRARHAERHLAHRQPDRPRWTLPGRARARRHAEPRPRRTHGALPAAGHSRAGAPLRGRCGAWRAGAQGELSRERRAARLPLPRTRQQRRIPHHRRSRGREPRLRAQHAGARWRAGLRVALAGLQRCSRRTGVRPRVDDDPQRPRPPRRLAFEPGAGPHRQLRRGAGAGDRWGCGRAAHRHAALRQHHAGGRLDWRCAGAGAGGWCGRPEAGAEPAARRSGRLEGQGQRRAGRQRCAHHAGHAVARGAPRAGSSSPKRVLPSPPRQPRWSAATSRSKAA